MPKINQIRSLAQFWKRIILNEISEFRMSEYTFMVVVIAVMIGVLGSFGTILFRYSIKVVPDNFFWLLALWTGLCDSPALVYKTFSTSSRRISIRTDRLLFTREAKGHGVPEVREP